MSKKQSKAARKKKEQKLRRRRGFKAFIICLVVFGLMAYAARLIVFTTVKLESGVSPDYRAGDIAVVSKLSVWRGESYHEGQTVYSDFSGGDIKLLRTIKGVAGDYLEARGDEIVLIHNCENEVTEENLGVCPGLVNGTIPEGAFLLLGDDPRTDSRKLGLVYKNDIKGTGVAVIWPLGHMGAR